MDERVPADHPIGKLRVLVDAIVKELDDVLASRYAIGGRTSIRPERLLRASLLQVVYRVRSERLLMEPLNYNLLLRWFVGLNIDDLVWDHWTFSFNRERLFDAEIAQRFFAHTVLLARLNDLVSDEHFSVDGSLLDAWASHRSFRPKDGSDDGDGSDFRGQKRGNDTPASTKISWKVRKGIEQGFGWAKTIGDLRKLPLVGLAKVNAWVHWNFAAYHLIRLGGIGPWWNPSPT